MPRLTAMDEHFVHQIPEPLPVTAVHHDHWRESYFFVVHDRVQPGDVVILAMAHYPAREVMDALVMGRIEGEQVFARYERPYGDDPHTTTVGPASVRIVEPYRTVTLAVADEANLEIDLTFSARTAAYGLRRGRLDGPEGILWDQSHMIQSGTYTGHYRRGDHRVEVDGWWGQRDHSWGIRDHARIPMWMWLAIQLDDGMLGVWHWELADGSRIYTDGCWAPASGKPPVPVVDFHHDLRWTADGKPVAYGSDGAAVTGLDGTVRFTLAGGREITVVGSGTWCAPYRPFAGGGQHLMSVRTDDGREGQAIYEVTGRDHHRFFPG